MYVYIYIYRIPPKWSPRCIDPIWSDTKLGFRLGKGILSSRGCRAESPQNQDHLQFGSWPERNQERSGNPREEQTTQICFQASFFCRKKPDLKGENQWKSWFPSNKSLGISSDFGTMWPFQLHVGRYLVLKIGKISQKTLVNTYMLITHVQFWGNVGKTIINHPQFHHK